tara:strand:- start:7667 stop:7837 length:171 start_codon:yes stop_codon:yes gene_type:complete
MAKLTEDQMIKIIRANTIETCTEQQKTQIYLFGFGAEYMRQPDDTKGTLQTYEETE